jgi:hypothetical protein
MLNTISGLLAGGAVATDYESIATTTVGGGGAATITFSSIPSTYTHLQIRVMTINSAYGNLRFNNDTTAANYYSHLLGGTGAAAYAAAYSSSAYFPNTGSTSTSPYVEVMDILDYANANKYKTTRGLGGIDVNGSGGTIYGSSSNLWMNTSAINRIDITANTGSFAQYSSFALYGIK